MIYYLYCPQRILYYPAGEQETFNRLDDISERLADYHDIDYDGVKDNDEPYESIHEFLDTLENERERLSWLLDYGDWEVHDENESFIDIDDYTDDLTALKQK